MGILKKTIRLIKTVGIFPTCKKIFVFTRINIYQMSSLLYLKIIFYIKGKTLIRNYNGIFLQFNNDGDKQELLYHSDFNYHYYKEMDVVKKYIYPGFRVFDIGANVGLTTILFSKLVGNNGKVFSFEPSRINFQKLINNVKINKLGNVHLFNYGLGEKVGEMNLVYNPNQSGLSTLTNPMFERGMKEKIRIEKMDNIISLGDGKIDFIKLDCEGYEPNILLGGKEFIEMHKPIIYLELGSAYLEQSYKSIEILKELNYISDAFEINLSKIATGTNFIAMPISI